MQLVLFQMLNERAASAVDNALGRAGGPGGIHNIKRMVKRQWFKNEGRTALGRQKFRPVNRPVHLVDRWRSVNNGHHHQLRNTLNFAANRIKARQCVDGFTVIEVAIATKKHLGFNLSKAVHHAINPKVR